MKLLILLILSNVIQISCSSTPQIQSELEDENQSFEQDFDPNNESTNNSFEDINELEQNNEFTNSELMNNQNNNTNQLNNSFNNNDFSNNNINNEYSDTEDTLDSISGNKATIRNQNITTNNMINTQEDSQTKSSSDELDSEEQKNLQIYEEHFKNFFAGRAEGAYIVSAQDCPVYDTPSEEANIVHYLKINDDIHALSDDGKWVHIGRNKYVLKKDVQSLGYKTHGLYESDLSREEMN